MWWTTGGNLPATSDGTTMRTLQSMLIRNNSSHCHGNLFYNSPPNQPRAAVIIKNIQPLRCLVSQGLVGALSEVQDCKCFYSCFLAHLVTANLLFFSPGTSTTTIALFCHQLLVGKLQKTTLLFIRRQFHACFDQQTFAESPP